MSFDQAAVNTIFSNVVSNAMQLGVFRRVNSHEPKAAPGSGLTYVVWVDQITPIGRASGLDATSGYVVLNGRIYGNAFLKPEDDLDPRILTAATTLIGQYSSGFTFGETVRNIDLLGEYGQRLGAQAGYVTIGQTVYRVMTLTIPLVVNDMWTQAA